jgi:hypothetical protein
MHVTAYFISHQTYRVEQKKKNDTEYMRECIMKHHVGTVSIPNQSIKYLRAGFLALSLRAEVSIEYISRFGTLVLAKLKRVIHSFHSKTAIFD